MAPTLEPRFVPVPQALRFSGLGKTTLYQLIKDGRLKSVAIGRRRLIDLSSLRDLLEADHA